MDIDHIYATALASRMHAADKRRAHHAERWRVNTIGNMWLLDAGANRALHDDKPPKKFKLLEGWLGATPGLHRVLPRANWPMTELEIQRFIEVDIGLEPPDDWRPTDTLPTELAERMGMTPALEKLKKASNAATPVGTLGVPGERRPILDVPRRWGWPNGWRSEFAYVDFRGERWGQRNVKTLFNETFKWLWANRREDVLRWNEQAVERSAFEVGLIASSAHYGHWDRLDDEHYLQMGMHYQYLVKAVQDVLAALDLADGVFVVYANAD